MEDYRVIEEVKDLYRIVAFKVLRQTPGVFFDAVPVQALPHIDAIDRVIHSKGAVSPGKVENVDRPWYMHPFQDDNLLVLFGTRHVDIYTPGHGEIESFTVSPDRILKNGRVVYDGPGMLVWPKKVFHRIRSAENGSASINLAAHYDGFDIETNFNIYDVDTQTGKFQVIRKGLLDQNF